MELNIEPKVIRFEDVGLHQAYVKTLSLENLSAGPIDFAVNSSSTRYAINPQRGHLNKGEAIAISVKLYLNHFPAKSSSDHIIIKTSFFSPIKVPIDLISSEPTQARSRSPSPNRANVGSSHTKSGIHTIRASSPDIVREMEAKIEYRDRVIQEYEELLGKLRSKAPDFERIIEDRIERERQSFEEKSAKVLKILRKKDDEITNLQKQLNEEQRKVDELNGRIRLQEQPQKDYWTGRPIRHTTFADYHQQKHDQEQLEALQTENKSLQTRIQSLEGELQSMGDDAMANMSKGTLIQEMKSLELINLRLREENEILSKEMKEFNSMQTRYDQMKKENISLSRRLQEIQEQYQKLEISCEEIHKEKELISKQLKEAHEFHGYYKSQLAEAQTKADNHFVIEYDEKVEGGLSTKVPRSYALHTASTLPTQHALDTMKAYKDMNDELEQKTQQLMTRLQEMSSMEVLLRDQLQEKEKLIERLETTYHSSLQEITELKQQLECPVLHANPNITNTVPSSPRTPNLPSSSDKQPSGTGKGKQPSPETSPSTRSREQTRKQEQEAMDTKSGHEWWSYIWHMLQKQYAMEDSVQGGGGNTHSVNQKVGEYHFDLHEHNPLEHEYHITKLRDNLRLQGIELATTRQELLKLKIDHKQTSVQQDQHVEHLYNDRRRLERLLALKKQEKDVKFQEVINTNKMLSNRTDLHQQLYSLSTQLEESKLRNMNLVFEKEEIMALYEKEQRKAQQFQQEVTLYQQKYYGQDVYGTISNIPGINPLVVMELMSGELIALENAQQKLTKEYDELYHENKRLHSQLVTYVLHDQQPKVQQTIEEGNDVEQDRMNTTIDTAATTTSMKSKVKTLTEHFQQKALQKPKPINAAVSGTGLTGGGMNNSKTIIAQHLEIDPETTTPKMLLQCYDVMLLQEQITVQNQYITELQNELTYYHHHHGPLNAESVTTSPEKTTNPANEAMKGLHLTGNQIFELEIIPLATKREYEALQVKQEYYVQQINEYSQEITGLKEQILAYEKSLLIKQVEELNQGIVSTPVTPMTAGTGSYKAAVGNRKDDIVLIPQPPSSFQPFALGGSNSTSAMEQVAGSMKAKHEKEQMQKEMISLQQQLKEKTVQNKILSETLTTLQFAGTTNASSNAPGASSSANTDIPPPPPPPTTQRDSAYAIPPLHTMTSGGDNYGIQLQDILQDQYVPADVYYSGMNQNQVPRNLAYRGQSVQQQTAATISSAAPGNNNYNNNNNNNSVEGNWVAQGLIKRVIGLTTELTSQVTLAHNSQCTIQQLETQLQEQSNQLILTKQQIAQYELIHQQSLQMNELLKQELLTQQDQYIDQISSGKEQYQQVLATLKEQEQEKQQLIWRIQEQDMLQLDNKKHLIQELCEYLSLDNLFVSSVIAKRDKQLTADEKDQTKKTETEELVALLLAAAGTSEVASDEAKLEEEKRLFINNTSDNTLHKRLDSFFQEWKDYLSKTPSHHHKSNPNSPSKSSSSSSTSYQRLTKQEETFYQRITDLISSCYQENESNKMKLRKQEQQVKYWQQQHIWIQEKFQLFFYQMMKLYSENQQYQQYFLATMKRTLPALQTISSMPAMRSAPSHTIVKGNNVSGGGKHKEKMGKLSPVSPLHNLSIETEHILTAYYQQQMHVKQAEIIQLQQSNKQLKQQYGLLSIQSSLQGYEIQKLHYENAQLDATKTSHYLQQKEELLHILQEKMKKNESMFYQWYSEELPRLLYGMPIDEDHFSEYHNYPNHQAPSSSTMWTLPKPTLPTGTFHYPSGTVPSFSVGGNQGDSSKNSVDVVFTLSEALCASKANESSLLLKITELQEQLQIYKQKQYQYEGIFLKWKDNIHSLELDTLILTQPPSIPTLSSMNLGDGGFGGGGGGTVAVPQSGKRLTNQEEEQLLLLSLEKEEEYQTTIQSLQERLLHQEESTIEVQGKLAYTVQQLTQIQSIITQLEEQDASLRTKSLHQLNKLRNELEKEHYEELSTMRQMYEHDREQLLQQIDSVSHAVHEANLVSQQQNRNARDEDGEPIMSNKLLNSMIQQSSSVPSNSVQINRRKPLAIDGLDILSTDEQDAAVTEGETGQHKDDNNTVGGATHQSSSSSSQGSSKRYVIITQPPDRAETGTVGSANNHSKGSTSNGGRSVEEQGLDAFASQLSHSVSTNSMASQKRQQDEIPHQPPQPPQPLHAVEELPQFDSIEGYQRDPHNTGPGQDSASHNIPAPPPPPPTLRTATNIAASTKPPRDRRISLKDSKPTSRRRSISRQRQPDSSSSNSSSSDASTFDPPSFRASLAAMANLSHNEDMPNNTSAESPSHIAQLEHLLRVIELEKRKTSEAKLEIKELQELLSVQQQMMKEHMSSAASRRSDSSSTSSSSSSSVTSSHQISPQDQAIHMIEEEVAKEEQSLWPAIGTIADELLSILQTILPRVSTNERTLIRSAMTMAARVKSSTSGNINLLDTITQRMNVLEQDLLQQQPSSEMIGPNTTASSTIPDRYIYLLRDLRQRVNEFQQQYDSSMRKQTEEFETERGQLLLQIEQLQQHQVQQHEQVATMNANVMPMSVTSNQYFEITIKNLQSTLNSIVSTSTQEIQRLEEENRKLQISLRHPADYATMNAKPAPMKSKPPSKAPKTTSVTNFQPELELDEGQSQATNNSTVSSILHMKDNLDELVRLQQQLYAQQRKVIPRNTYKPDTHNDYDNERSETAEDENIRRQEEKEEYAQELTDLQKQFQQYKTVSEQMVSNLEYQLNHYYELSNQSLNDYPSNYHKHHRSRSPSQTTKKKTSINKSKQNQEEEEDYSVFSGIPPHELQALPRIKRQGKYNQKGGMDTSPISASSDGHEGDNDSDASDSEEEKGGNPGRQPSSSALPDYHLEHQFKNMEFKYKMKCQELDSALKALEKVTSPRKLFQRPPLPSNNQNNQQQHNNSSMMFNDSNLSAIQPVVPPPQPLDPTNNDQAGGGNLIKLAHEIRYEMKAAQLETAEKEIEMLHKSIANERGIAAKITHQYQSLQQQYQQVQRKARGTTEFEEANDEVLNNNNNNNNSNNANYTMNKSTFTAGNNTTVNTLSDSYFLREFNRDFVLPNNLEHNERAKDLVKRANFMRKHAKQEIVSLREQLQAIQDSIPKETVNKLKQTIAENKITINNLKEELQRKSKLYQACKEAKTSDNNAIETWKHEVHTLEETIKRLQKSLSSKEQMIKDLKNKCESLEDVVAISEKGVVQEVQQMFGTSSGGGGAMADVYQMSAPEMRSKIKEYELERARNRARTQALKEKITELEQSIVTLQEEKEQLQKSLEKQENTKVSITRKDQLIQQLKTQIDKLKQEYDQVTLVSNQQQQESEKRIKQLQRQIDTALKLQHDNEREILLMRQRLTNTRTQQALDQQHRATGSSASSATTATIATGTSSKQTFESTNNATTPAPSTASIPPQPRKSSVASTSSANAVAAGGIGFRHSVSPSPPISVQEEVNVPLPSSLQSSRHDLHDVIQAISGVTPVLTPTPIPDSNNNNNMKAIGIAAPVPVAATSSMAANTLLQRLNGLSSVLLNESSISHHSSSSSGSSSNDGVPGVLDMSSSSSSNSSSSSSSSLTHSPAPAPPPPPASTTNIERRLQALVSRTMQQTAATTSSLPYYPSSRL